MQLVNAILSNYLINDHDSNWRIGSHCYNVSNELYKKRIDTFKWEDPWSHIPEMTGF